MYRADTLDTLATAGLVSVSATPDPSGAAADTPVAPEAAALTPS
jgi:hypothetical protein